VWGQQARAQCSNGTSDFGDLAAPAAGACDTIANASGSSLVYYTLTGVAAGATYSITQPSARITVHTGTVSTGTLVADATGGIVTFVAPSAGDYFMRFRSATCTDGTLGNAIVCNLRVCTNGTAAATSALPAAGSCVSTGITAEEYWTVNSVVVDNYRITSSAAGDWITVRSGTPGGTPVASGTSPLYFAGVAGTLYIHVNTNSSCGTNGASRTVELCRLLPACNNATPIGEPGTAPAEGACTPITNVWAGRHVTVGSFIPATYSIGSGISGDYITVRSGTSGGAVVASGPQPLTFNNTVSGTLWIHVNTNSSCGANTTFRTIIVCRPCPITPAVFDGMLYTEDFESWVTRCSVNSAGPSAHWNNLPATGNASWRRHDQGSTAAWTGEANGLYAPVSSQGSSSARWHSFWSGNGDAGHLDLHIDMGAAAGNVELRFAYINGGASNNGDNLTVWQSTDGGASFTQLGAQLNQSAGNTWQQVTRALTSTSTATVIRFRASKTAFDQNDIGIDDLRISAQPVGLPELAGPAALRWLGQEAGSTHLVAWPGSTIRGLEVLDALGRPVRVNAPAQAGETVRIDLGGHASGTYLLRAYGGAAPATVRLVHVAR